ncbi:MAG: hypothetical protein QXU52_02090 [Fervidicoccaceae archaeon]
MREFPLEEAVGDPMFLERNLDHLSIAPPLVGVGLAEMGKGGVVIEHEELERVAGWWLAALENQVERLSSLVEARSVLTAPPLDALEEEPLELRNEIVSHERRAHVSRRSHLYRLGIFNRVFAPVHFAALSGERLPLASYFAEALFLSLVERGLEEAADWGGSLEARRKTREAVESAQRLGELDWVYELSLALASVAEELRLRLSDLIERPLLLKRGKRFYVVSPAELVLSGLFDGRERLSSMISEGVEPMEALASILGEEGSRPIDSREGALFLSEIYAEAYRFLLNEEVRGRYGVTGTRLRDRESELKLSTYMRLERILPLASLEARLAGGRYSFRLALPATEDWDALVVPVLAATCLLISVYCSLLSSVEFSFNEGREIRLGEASALRIPKLRVGKEAGEAVMASVRGLGRFYVKAVENYYKTMIGRLGDRERFLRFVEERLRSGELNGF